MYELGLAMNKSTKNKMLEAMVESIQITTATMDSAEKSYISLGEWLNREDSVLKRYAPAIYSQGSIKLGTAIKPLSENDDFDLDSVCVLKNLTTQQFSQSDVKKLIGFEIKAYVSANNFNNEATEGKRCWTIEYANSSQFHMDILPAIPNKNHFIKILEAKNMYDKNNPYTQYAIAITDNTTYNYSYVHDDWLTSNPKGYYKWFLQRSIVKKYAGNDRLRAVMENVEKLPDNETSSILQKVIMIFKRHRDTMFKDDTDNKPISIIITTLVAHAYNGEDNMEDAVVNILSTMSSFIKFHNGIYRVENPVNPLENFADKWENEPIKQINFTAWLRQLKIDIEYIVNGDYSNKKQLLENAFGQTPINKAFNVNGVKNTFANNIAGYLLSMTHVKSPTWKSNIKSGVSISCIASYNGHLTKDIQTNEAVSKSTSLRFEAKLSNKVHGGSIKYYWQVANSGREAENANCLRGGIFDNGEISKGGKVKTETTSYYGEHFVRCFAIQHGEMIAMSDPFLVKVA